MTDWRKLLEMFETTTHISRRTVAMTLTAALTILLTAVPMPAAHADGQHAQHDHHAASDGIGEPGDAARVTRTIDVDMHDAMRFTPATITVKRGETIRFNVKNSGRVRHEMMLGTVSALREHAEMMRKMPQMEHAEPNAVTVDPGKRGEFVWHFTQAGEVPFACLEPGHFEAGMVGTIRVRADAGSIGGG
ncbi:copper-binding protein [Pandoraea terrae]|uniref:Copper-binding protein n=1 Tax=Pandoraea terrae TaxID=1537710 RepID=A0A5E4V688_9BURK|nr:copper-binding protein [Pandoraea terrae]